MDSSESFVIAVVASLTGVIGAVTAWLTAWLVVLQKIKDVHTIVNSQKSAMVAEIAELKNQVEKLNLLKGINK